MAKLDILRRRLQAQRLIGPGFATPAEAVVWFGAVQAQDYRGALWGVAQRTENATDGDVERALADRSIVRTWPMRGTLHFVAADDVRWLTRLLAPRIIKRAAGRHRELGLDAKAFTRSRQLLREALAGTQLERSEVYDVLVRGRVSPDGQRGIHIIGQLAMEGVVCFGAPRGKQQTFALLDDWIPESRVLEAPAALGELARRYFTSHGPATVQDFAWWTGLTVTEARQGVERAAPELVEQDGYWSAASVAALPRTGATAHLLPMYDEYTVAYRDRSAFLDPADTVRAKNGIFSPVLLLDGKVAGLWRRERKRDRTIVTIDPFERQPAARRPIERAVTRYGAVHRIAAELAIAGTPKASVSSARSRSSARTSGSARRGPRRARRRHPRSSSRCGDRSPVGRGTARSCGSAIPTRS